MVRSVDSITLHFFYELEVVRDIQMSLPADRVETMGPCCRNSEESDGVDAESSVGKIIAHSRYEKRMAN